MLFASLEQHCPQCCNGRVTIKRDAKDCFDTEPCRLCRPAPDGNDDKSAETD